MINKQEIKNIAKRILKFRRGVRDHQIIHPSRDWFIGLAFAVLLFGISAAWSAQVYISHKNTSVSEVTGEIEEVVVYREAMVAAALQYFGDKQEFYTNLLNAKYLPEQPAEDTEVEETENEEVTATSSESVVEVSPQEEPAPEEAPLISESSQSTSTDSVDEAPAEDEGEPEEGATVPEPSY